MPGSACERHEGCGPGGEQAGDCRSPGSEALRKDPQQRKDRRLLFDADRQQQGPRNAIPPGRDRGHLCDQERLDSHKSVGRSADGNGAARRQGFSDAKRILDAG